MKLYLNYILSRAFLFRIENKGSAAPKPIGPRSDLFDFCGSRIEME
jgi:hypothetical protein